MSNHVVVKVSCFLTWFGINMEHCHSKRAGQCEVSMATAEMDPAPAAKAGSDDAAKVWNPMKSKMVNAESCAAGDAGEGSDLEPAEPLDESKMVTLLGTCSSGSKKAHVPPSFFSREAYAELDTLGLTEIPPLDGYGLSYHKVSFQWHARCGAKNFAPSWGEGIRSEKKALLLALMKLWDWYLEAKPDDSDAKTHQDSLALYFASVSF